MIYPALLEVVEGLEVQAWQSGVFGQRRALQEVNHYIMNDLEYKKGYHVMKELYERVRRELK